MKYKLLALLSCFLIQGYIDAAEASSYQVAGPELTMEEAMTDMVIRYQYAPDHEKVRVVNRFFNRMPYRGDMGWAVQAKKEMLIDMGIEPDRLWAAHVKHRKTQDDLTVLLVYPEHGGDDALVLDSFSPGIYPLSQRRDLFLIRTISGS